MNTQRSVAFLYTNNKLSEWEIKKMIPYNYIKKNKMLRNRFNQGGKRYVY